MKKHRIGQYRLEDGECKTIPDGYEICAETVERLNIDPRTIHTANGRPVRADWGYAGSIFVEPRWV